MCRLRLSVVPASQFRKPNPRDASRLAMAAFLPRHRPAIARRPDLFVETTMHLSDFVHKNIFVH
jgi:hypothetical protein